MPPAGRRTAPLPDGFARTAAQPRTDRRWGRRIARFFGRLGIALLGLIVGFGIYAYYLLGKPLLTDIPIVSPQTGTAVPLDNYTVPEVNIDGAWGEGGRVRVYVNKDFPIEQVDQIDKNVENILIFGVDARSPEDYICRADSIIILSIDKKNHCIKLTSIMRDTEVDLPGRSSNEKINASYAFGGVGLLINTINQNFGLDVQRFAMFDFYSATELIDIVGGIEIDVLAEELPNLSEILDEMNALFHRTAPPDYVKKAGLQKLTGTQAIAWARIRKVGSDHERTARQRTVMMTLIQQFSRVGLTTKISFLDTSLGQFETNLGRADMLRIGLDAMQNMKEIRQYKVPAEGMYTTNPENWNMVLNWDKQLAALHAFLWD
ncbi:MAG TPA: LCP family protein [Clostridia bacterium]